MKKTILVLLTLFLIATTANAIELIRQKNEATTVQFLLIDADGDPVSGATNLDSEYSYVELGDTAWSAFTDCNAEATENASSGAYTLTVAQAEINHDFVQLKITSSEAKTRWIDIRTTVGAPELGATTDDGGPIAVTGGKVDEIAVLTGHTPQSADHTSVLNTIAEDTAAYDSDAERAAAIWGAARANYKAAGTFGQSLQLVHSGTAEDGNSETITLDASAAGTYSYYDDCMIFIIGGTGAGQARRIETYYGDANNNMAALTPAWTVAPNNTSVFVILPATKVLAELEPGTIPNVPSAAENADAVWNETSSGHDTIGKAGGQLWTKTNTILAKTNNLPDDPASEGNIDDVVNDYIWSINSKVNTIYDRIPAEVAQKQHLVNGTGDITPPANKGLWDAIGTLPEVQATVSPTVHCLLIDLFGAMDEAAESIIALENGIWTYNIEGDLSVDKMLRIIFAVLAGDSNRQGSLMTFRDIADTKNRLTVTNPAPGVRTDTILDGD